MSTDRKWPSASEFSRIRAVRQRVVVRLKSEGAPASKIRLANGDSSSARHFDGLDGEDLFDKLADYVMSDVDDERVSQKYYNAVSDNYSLAASRWKSPPPPVLVSRNPRCFVCQKELSSERDNKCSECGWLVCPIDSSCGCTWQGRFCE